MQWFTHRDVPFDVFDDHGSVVDENANRQGKSAQGHGIERLSGEIDEQNGRDDGQRNRGKNDHGQADITQKQDDDQRGERGRQAGTQQHAVQRPLHKHRLVEQGLDGHVLGQHLLDVKQGRAHAIDDGERRHAAGLADGDERTGSAVDGNRIGLYLKAVMDMRNVAHEDCAAGDLLDRVGIDGIDEPLESIEDMARFYLDAVRKMQARGPYLLIGYSLGGLVVLEMAQRLTTAGEKVALLAMIDAYPHMSQLSLSQRTLLIARQARRGLRSLTDLRGGGSYQPPPGVLFTPAMQRVRDSAYLALTRYRPHYYPGKIKFVRAEISSGFPNNATAVWANLAKKIEVETVPGDHLGMIATHFEKLASVLSQYLEEATR